MRRFSPEGYEREAGAARRAVFVDDDAFGCPFAAEVEARAILYLTSYDLSAPQLAVLAEVAGRVGDVGYYYSAIERIVSVEDVGGGVTRRELARGASANPQPDEVEDAWVRFDDTDRPPAWGENLIHSAHGTWGLMFSHEWHTLVGGSRRLVDELLDAWPIESYESPAREQVHDFIEDAREWPDAQTWLPKHIAHVYGEDEARRLLERAVA